jgi:hypothetical protein
MCHGKMNFWPLNGYKDGSTTNATTFIKLHLAYERNLTKLFEQLFKMKKKKK